MFRAKTFFDNDFAGQLIKMENGRKYHFQYAPGYNGPPVSLTMPVREESYSFDEFSTFFDGLLPDGIQLEVLLRQKQLVYEL
ncbi:MAG: HipA N-terminal domain-containing protein [Proteobacteria bacterium]|nr:HipA N-terminal domain-containing protein [Pseudomonadota bacterium]